MRLSNVELHRVGHYPSAEVGEARSMQRMVVWQREASGRVEAEAVEVVVAPVLDLEEVLRSAVST